MKKILVVDDDTGILYAVTQLLTMNGFNVQTHETGLNVANVVMQYHPNLILMDVRLPGKLGTEVCKEFKQIYAHLPIILFSANIEEMAFSLYNAGAFIQKPFDIKNLKDTINLHLN